MKKIRLRRTRNRVYAANGGGKAVTVPAEYALFDGSALLARIIRMGDGWRACRPTQASVIGTAISPVGMDRFKAVRDWALANLGKQKKEKNHGSNNV